MGTKDHREAAFEKAIYNDDGNKPPLCELSFNVGWQAALASRAAVPSDDVVERVADAMWDVVPSYGDVTFDEARDVFIDSKEWQDIISQYLIMSHAAIAAMQPEAQDDNQCREAFEEWAVAEGGLNVRKHVSGSYKKGLTLVDWEAWQAAWKEKSK